MRRRLSLGQPMPKRSSPFCEPSEKRLPIECAAMSPGAPLVNGFRLLGTEFVTTMSRVGGAVWRLCNTRGACAAIPVGYVIVAILAAQRFTAMGGNWLLGFLLYVFLPAIVMSAIGVAIGRPHTRQPRRGPHYNSACDLATLWRPMEQGSSICPAIDWEGWPGGSSGEGHGRKQ